MKSEESIGGGVGSVGFVVLSLHCRLGQFPVGGQVQVPFVPGFQCRLTGHFSFLVFLWLWADSAPNPRLPTWDSSRCVKSRRWEQISIKPAGFWV